MESKITSKTFNWENYTAGRESYKFEDLTEGELKEWAGFFEFKREEVKGKIYLRGKYNNCKILWR